MFLFWLKRLLRWSFLSFIDGHAESVALILCHVCSLICCDFNKYMLKWVLAFAFKSTWAEDQAADIPRCRCAWLMAGWVWRMPHHRGIHTRVLGTLLLHLEHIAFHVLTLQHPSGGWRLIDYKYDVYMCLCDTFFCSFDSNNVFGKLNIPKPLSCTSERKTSYFGK